MKSILDYPGFIVRVGVFWGCVIMACGFKVPDWRGLLISAAAGATVYATARRVQR